MGAYINPTNETKEEFLRREGRVISLNQAADHKDFEKDFLVVLVDNGLFTAAGIAYDGAERDAFLHHGDRRPKQYYLVSKDILLPVSTLGIYLRKEGKDDHY